MLRLISERDNERTASSQVKLDEQHGLRKQRQRPLPLHAFSFPSECQFQGAATAKRGEVRA